MCQPQAAHDVEWLLNLPTCTAHHKPLEFLNALKPTPNKKVSDMNTLVDS